jgi:alpha-L-rhamnosidase
MGEAPDEADINGTITYSLFWVMALDAAAELHVAAGDAAPATAFSRQADTLRQTCRSLFWEPAQKLFIDNFEATKQGTHFSRQCNALAILSGVCTPEQRSDVLRHVFLNKQVAPVGTPYMMFFEARALALCNEREAMMDMLRDYWGNMIEAGATTFWEAHDLTLQGDQRYAFYGRPYGKSLCHAWSSGPLHLLSLELFGLRPLKCGWAEFTVNPSSSKLEWACVETPTPHGPIKVEVSGRHVTIAFPKGTTLVRGSGKSAERHTGPAIVIMPIPPVAMSSM